MGPYFINEPSILCGILLSYIGFLGVLDIIRKHAAADWIANGMRCVYVAPSTCRATRALLCFRARSDSIEPIVV